MQKNERENKYKQKYEEAMKTVHLMDGEVMRHCLDEVSFGGRYYQPQWAITNFGRCYSLSQNKWNKAVLKSGGRRDKEENYTSRRYYYENITVHSLVANYFCDKKIIDKYGEGEVEVHHRVEFNASKSNEENNFSENLEYELIKLHRDVMNQIQRGIRPKDNKICNEMQLLAKTFAYQDNSKISSEINENGNLRLEMEIPIKSKFATSEEWAMMEEYLIEKGISVTIKKVIVNQDGTLTVKYSDGHEKTFSRLKKETS